jgi:hypothetical protein
MYRLKILWSKFKIKVVSTIVNIFASQTNDDVENTVLIIGSARSGTTFLMESLNCNNEFRVIFEPFNPTYTKEWKGFGARHYIDPENVNDKEAEAIHTILKGKINNKWVDQYNRKIRSDQRLIKSVRANLLLDFVESKYPALKIIYIYRDPYKVVASRINLNFDHKDVYIILRHNKFLERYYSDIEVETLNAFLHTPENCHTALWCLENRFLLESQKQRNMNVVQYENIVGKTIVLVKNELVVSHAIRQPSVTSSVHGSYQLSKTEISNIDGILSFFAMDEFIKDNQIK